MKKISIGYCIGIISFFMLSIFLRVITQNIFIEKFNIDNGFTKTILFDIPRFNISSKNIDWEKLYPFNTSFSNSNSVNLFYKFKSKIITLEERIRNSTRDHLLYRVLLVELAVLYENIIGWKLDDEVIDLGDGYFVSPVNKAAVLPDSDHPYTPGSSICEFNDFLAGLGINFLYVQFPHKIGKNDAVVGDFSNKNADELLRMLSDKNIPYLDIRESIYQEGKEHHSLFYKTDHHWKAETGLWAAGIISNYLNENNGFAIDTDIFLPERYRYDVYEHFFLGSQGRKITLLRTAPDDFSLIYPLFNTDLSLQIPSKNINAQGSFDIFYWYEQMRYYQIEKVGYYNLSRYGTYMYNDNPLTGIHNNLTHDNKKICFIIDSFGLAVIPFLSLGMGNIDVLDIRSSVNGFSGSVRTYMEKHKPDMVVVMYNPNAIVFPPLDYAAKGSAFDFR